MKEYSLLDDPALTGLTDETYSSPDNGDVGDGSTGPSDWISSAFNYIKKGADAASSVVSLVNGGKSIPQDLGSVPVSQSLPATGPNINAQNMVSFFSKMPWWGWALVGVGVLIGFGVLLKALFGR